MLAAIGEVAGYAVAAHRVEAKPRGTAEHAVTTTTPSGAAETTGEAQLSHGDVLRGTMALRNLFD
jgi:hypothetical protein